MYYLKLVAQWAAKLRLASLPVLLAVLAVQVWAVSPWWLQKGLSWIWSSFLSLRLETQVEIVASFFLVWLAQRFVRRWWLHAVAFTGIVYLTPWIPFDWKWRIIVFFLPAVVCYRVGRYLYLSDLYTHHRSVQPVEVEEGTVVRYVPPKLKW